MEIKHCRWEMNHRGKMAPELGKRWGH